MEEIRHYSSGTVHASLFIQNLWMNLDGFLATRRRISWWLLNRISAAIKRINAKRFRHLDGGLGLHQGFSCFSYIKGGFSTHSTPFFYSDFRLLTIFHSLVQGFQDFKEEEKATSPSPSSIFGITIFITNLSSRLGLLVVEDSRFCGFKIFILFIWCIST